MLKIAKYFLYLILIIIIGSLLVDTFAIQQARADIRLKTYLSGIYIINMKADQEELASSSTDLDKLYKDKDIKKQIEIMSESLFGWKSEGTKVIERGKQLDIQYNIKKGNRENKVEVLSEIITHGSDKGIKLTIVYYIKPTMLKLGFLGITDEYDFKVNITKNFRLGTGV